MAYPYKVKKLAKIVGQRPRMLTACVVLGYAVITIYSTSFPHLVALVFLAACWLRQSAVAAALVRPPSYPSRHPLLSFNPTQPHSKHSVPETLLQLAISPRLDLVGATGIAKVRNAAARMTRKLLRRHPSE